VRVTRQDAETASETSRRSLWPSPCASSRSPRVDPRASRVARPARRATHAPSGSPTACAPTECRTSPTLAPEAGSNSRPASICPLRPSNQPNGCAPNMRPQGPAAANASRRRRTSGCSHCRGACARTVSRTSPTRRRRTSPRPGKRCEVSTRARPASRRPRRGAGRRGSCTGPARRLRQQRLGPPPARHRLLGDPARRRAGFVTRSQTISGASTLRDSLATRQE
jgi:hypothetical protein